jgi:LuxR family transcriptional regulator, quorum-sensing system regulator SolR
MRDKFHRSVVVLLNSRSREVSSNRALEIDHLLGPITLLASHFHEAFMENVLDANLPPCQQGAALSPRETQCLQLASRGLTSADIAFKLNLVERTVNFHFANVMSKLAAANRVEAIAIAVSRQIIGA